MLSEDEQRFIKQKCKAIRRHLRELLPIAEQVEERAPEVTEFAFAINLDLNDLERALKESVAATSGSSGNPKTYLAKHPGAEEFILIPVRSREYMDVWRRLL
ncbi:hypothetical protein GFC01_05925 [Desulfofundulus thermobenzoicus]|uniref:Uncharacterized protein n=1 Tax=Desulfofundulus thermobenzoicus TaxID=29376 RepID=A0A6N7IQJ8_9FIRM|nr:hypothetical protein [Desulfofundulus thermobenzoicus]MQL51807.1 hypothetical protein [Desulfofundulus thermobenzoicus]